MGIVARIAGVTVPDRDEDVAVGGDAGLEELRFRGAGRVDCGVDTTIEVECPECFTVQEVELPFDKGFFLPGRDRTARRRARSGSSPT